MLSEQIRKEECVSAAYWLKPDDEDDDFDYEDEHGEMESDKKEYDDEEDDELEETGRSKQPASKQETNASSALKGAGDEKNTYRSQAGRAEPRAAYGAYIDDDNLTQAEEIPS